MNKEILHSILSRRADLIKLIFVVFLLALGTGLIVNYLTIIFELKSQVLIWSGISLVIIVFLYLIISILLSCKRKVSVSGTVLFDKNEIVSADRYEFSEKLSETINAVFLENEALKHSWDSDFKVKDEEKSNVKTKIKKEEKVEAKEIQYFSIVRVESDDNEPEKQKNSRKILKEAVEYVFIENLSTHLSSYFNNYNNENKILKEFTRTDFPNILLENRIINLLSSPFEDRPIFLKAKMSKMKHDGEIVAIMGSDGSRYSRFDLVLPKKSRVTRKQDGLLQIKSPRLTLDFKIDYKGFTATLPRGFEYNYLGYDSKEISANKIDVELSIYINPLSLLFNKGWNYYNWIDSFTKEFEELFSFKKFLADIDWNSTLTRIITSNRRHKFMIEHERKQKKQKEEEKLPPIE